MTTENQIPLDGLIDVTQAASTHAAEPAPCVWPNCLELKKHQELAEEVARQMRGEDPSPAATDQRDVCNCTATQGWGALSS